MLGGSERDWVDKIRSTRGGFKPYYRDIHRKRNLVGVILKEQHVNSIVQVKSVRQDHKFKAGSRRDDVECCLCMCPTVWMSVRRERRTNNELDEEVESDITERKAVIGSDFSGHVAEGNRSHKEVLDRIEGQNLKETEDCKVV